MKRLGDVLIDTGLLTIDQLGTAVVEQDRQGSSLGRALLKLGMLTDSQLVSALATQIGLPFVDLAGTTVDGAAIASAPASVCRRHSVPLIGFDSGKLILALADPANVYSIDGVRSLSGFEVRKVVATRADVLTAIDRFHRGDDEFDELTMSIETSAEDLDPAKVTEIVEDAPIVKFVNLLIAQAIGDRASDIQIEPAEREMRVRFRIDGVLHEIMRSPKSIQTGVTSRLKILADINIAERRIPQDGRMSINTADKKIDLRVATLPTVWGERSSRGSWTTRPPCSTSPTWASVAATMTGTPRASPSPTGWSWVTGPTGSGKSTRLRRDAEHRLHAREERHYGRGPGGVPVGRHQPGADQHEGRADLRGRAALDPAVGPRRRADRGDPGPRKRRR